MSIFSYKEKEIDSYFNCTKKERVAFELGIKFGTLFHQFIGAPVSKENRDNIEISIEGSMGAQPFVNSANVMIQRPEHRNTNDQFEYGTIEKDMIEAEIEVEYEGNVAIGKI